MGGSCESQTTGWLHTLVGFSSETSPDTHRELHESRENTSPLSWWWREMKPPRTRLSLFSRNRGFVCRKKSHEAVGWGHWWKSHWWRRQKRKTKLHSWRWEKSVEGPPWTPAEQGDPNGLEGKLPSKSALNCAQTPPASKSWTSGCAHAKQLKKKKKLQFVLYNIPTSQQNFMKYDGCQENTQSEDTEQSLDYQLWSQTSSVGFKIAIINCYIRRNIISGDWKL